MSLTLIESTLCTPAARRALAPAVAWLREHGEATGLHGTVAIGLPDPGTWGRLSEAGPFVLIAAGATRHPAPSGIAALAAARAVICLGEGDAARVAALGRTDDLLRVTPETPAPEATAAGVAIPVGDAAAEAAAAVWQRTRQCDPPEDGPAVAWVSGAAAEPLMQALNAWADGSAVVLLPGADGGAELVRRGALAARGPLEVVEATLLLRSAPVLRRALARRGARDGAPGPLPAVAEAVLEAFARAAGPA